MKIAISKPNIKMLENAVEEFVELAECKGSIKGSRERFQNRMDYLDMIKWAIICEAVNLVKSGMLEKLKGEKEDG